MEQEITVWTYWEGPCPDYIQLCIESMRRWCNVRLLNRPAFDQLWTEDRDLAIDSLYVAQRADFIRIYLLHHYGGVWIDADCIVLRPLTALISLLERCDLVCYREPTGTITNNFLIARAQTPVTRSYYQAVVDHLRAGRPIRWLEIGSVPLTAAIDNYPDTVKRIETEMIMPISWHESERFLDPVHKEALDSASLSAGTQHNAHAFCYMLSNHSMPERVRSFSREDILSTPTFLNYLFRVSLGAAALAPTAPNYRYWQRSGGEWGTEYNRRKMRHPFFHIQEMMITDYVAHHAPCRVLEFGCGTGRHLRNLLQIPGVDCYGYDQSSSMIHAGFEWASMEWQARHVSIGAPDDRLPYDDEGFDLVYTCEALLHTRPEDFKGRLAEIARVCRGHMLHIESPPTWTGYSSSCDGCWGHDFVSAYRDLGYQCEVLSSGFRHQVPYRTALRPETVRWTWDPAMLRLYLQLDISLEEGFSKVEAPALA